MNAGLLLFVGALVVAGPVAYLTLASPEPAVAASHALPAGDPTSSLRVIIKNSAEAQGDADLAIDGPGLTMSGRNVHLAPHSDATSVWPVWSGAYAVRVQNAQVRAAIHVDASACAGRAATVMFEGRFSSAGRSLVADPPTCDTDTKPAALTPSDPASTPARHYEGAQHVGLQVAGVPCGVGCSSSYGFFGDNDMGFPIERDGQKVTIHATWTPTTPATERMSIHVSHQDSECCGTVIAQQVGARDVTIVIPHAKAGDHAVGAWPDGPAGASIEQDVQYTVTVEDA